MVASGGTTRIHTDYEYPLQGINENIQSGRSYNFSFDSRIPTDIVNYTAIGTVTARFFILHLSTSYGCCANTASASVHIVLHSQTPRVSNKSGASKPYRFNPK